VAVDFSHIPVLAKKTRRTQAIGEAGDRVERDADRVADTVMRTHVPPGARCACGGIAGPSGECARCRAAREAATGARPQIARSGTGPAPTAVPQAVKDTLAAPGRPLESSARTFMEPRFGRSLADVRIHDDADAARSAALVGARAYTFGRHVVFGAGEFRGAEAGRRLLAHELAHVVQQESGNPALMRKALPFDSTIEMRHRVLKGQTKFEVTTGAIAVTADARWHIRDEEGEEERRQELPTEKVCGTPTYGITVTQEAWWDTDYGTCYFPSTGPRRAVWNKLPEDTYYLTIWVTDHNPYCVLEGQVHVEALSRVEGKTCTELPPGPMEKLHDALNLAGMIPALGAVPDAINAGIYAIEGDWKNAGISVAVAIPFLGDSFQAVRQGEKMVIKVAGKDVERLGTQKIAHALEEAKAEAKVAEAAKAEAQAEKDALRESEEAGKAAKRGRVPVPGLPGCRVGSLHCPIEYLAHEFADLFKARKEAEFAHYLREGIDYDLNMGRSLRKSQTILTGDRMYAQFMQEVPRSQWSKPFREAVDSGRTRELTAGGRRWRWPIDELDAPWVVHHDPPLGWITSESSKLWHPMPYRFHDEAHKWWSQLQKRVKGKIPKSEWARILEEGGSVVER
jgi:Domain of unknown function (DUF4157)